MANNRVTPFVKRMRAAGGTIYTFSSAVEDIGLNINERNNVVKISHFALLNIPSIADCSTGFLYNTFNIRNIAGCWEYEQGSTSTSIKDGRVLIAESFQNYALNLEANLLNQETYNPELTNTVAERVLWKWLKETGSIRWTDPFIAGNGVRYWVEEADSSDYGSVVKYIGPVSAGNVRVDTFGSYNETYILVPTSHGQTRAYFKQLEDDNYKHSMEIGDLGENILGRETYTRPHPDGLSYLGYYDFMDSPLHIGDYYTYYDNSTGTPVPGWWYSAEGIDPVSNENAYLTDASSYIDTGIYNAILKYDNGTDVIDFKRSKVDCINLEFNIDNLRTVYGDSALTYDTMATEYAENDKFQFNAVLIYYSIYNATRDAILATNLLGIMFLDAPSGNSLQILEGNEGILLPSLEKIQSGPTGFGTSYSLRLNIKTDNMIDDTAALISDSATNTTMYEASQWQQAFQNLNSAVNILTQQNSTLNFISGQYTLLQGQQTQLMNDIAALQYTVNDIGRDILGTAGTIALFSDGDDPLVDSSIFMKNGKIGFFNSNPTWPVQIDASLKVKDIYLEKAIRDVSGNILLSYGSPMQIGSSTGGREIIFYTGQGTPAFTIDSSNTVVFMQTVQFDGSVLDSGGQEIVLEDVVSESSLGPQFYWDGSLLFVNADVSGVYATEAYVDAEVGSVFDYVFNNIEPSILTINSSINDIWTEINTINNTFDSSFAYIDYQIENLEARPIPDVTRAYVDASLGLRDSAIIDLNNEDTSIYEVISDIEIEIDTLKNADTSIYEVLSDLDDLILNVENRVDDIDASKANIDSPVFTTLFGIGNWAFSLDGSDLILKHNNVTLFKFGTDGSLYQHQDSSI